MKGNNIRESIIEPNKNRIIVGYFKNDKSNYGNTDKKIGRENDDLIPRLIGLFYVQKLRKKQKINIVKHDGKQFFFMKIKMQKV